MTNNQSTHTSLTDLFGTIINQIINVMKIYVITEDYVNRYDNIFTNNIGCYKTYKGASDKLKELVENPTNKTCKKSEVLKRKIYIAKSTKDAEDSWGQVRYESGMLEYHIEVHEII